MNPHPSEFIVFKSFRENDKDIMNPHPSKFIVSKSFRENDKDGKLLKILFSILGIRNIVKIEEADDDFGDIDVNAETWVLSNCDISGFDGINVDLHIICIELLKFLQTIKFKFNVYASLWSTHIQFSVRNNGTYLTQHIHVRYNKNSDDHNNIGIKSDFESRCEINEKLNVNKL